MPFTAETGKEVFEKIKSVLQKQCPPMVISKDDENNFELIGNKPVPYGSTKKIVPGMFFVSIILNKTMVSFHFFPMYLNKEIYEPLVPNMIKLLKGKTCFNIKDDKEINEKELNALLSKGIDVWKKMGYLQ